MPGHTKSGASVATAPRFKISNLASAGQAAKQATLAFSDHGRAHEFGVIYYSQNGYYTVSWPGAVDISSQSQCAGLLSEFQIQESGEPVDASTQRDSRPSALELSVAERFGLSDGQKLVRVTLTFQDGKSFDEISPFEKCDFESLHSPEVQFLRLDFELTHPAYLSLIITRGGRSHIAVQVAADMACLDADMKARLLGFPPLRWAMHRHNSKGVRGIASTVDVDECINRLRDLALEFFAGQTKSISSDAPCRPLTAGGY